MPSSMRFWSCLLLGLAASGAATAQTGRAPARPPAVVRPGAPVPVPAAAEQGAVRQTLALEAGNGRVVSLGSPATNVFVADPRVAEVRPASTDSLFVFGVAPGRTTIAVMNADGRPIAQFEVTVRPSTFVANEAEAAVARLLPNARIRVLPQSRGLLVMGNVNSPAEAARAVSILRGYVAENQVIENQLSVQSAVQVNLRVRIIEMNRSVTRALGVDWAAVGNIGRFGIAGSTVTGLGSSLTPTGVVAAATKNVLAVVEALAQDNLVRVLAEPNLTVMSGQVGSFLAGGEFPVPVGQQNGTVTIEFKRYGVTLGVVPTVLSDGRINLHVSPEVSQLSTQGAVQLTAANNSIQVPALTVRRAETSVELGSGQTFAIAGLLQDQSTNSVTAVPFLGDLPVIGPLFRSSNFQRQETELVILVTPYVVRPSDDPAALHTPGERYTAPTDLERILLLRQVGTAVNRQPAPAIRIPGAAGFVVQ